MDNSKSFRKSEIREIVAATRLHLYNRGTPHGANAILQKMESMDIRPLPSINTINRILSRLELTHRRTGHYP